MNKKGNIQDLAYIALVLLFFSVVVLVGLKIAGSFNDGLASMDSSVVDDTTKQNTQLAVTRYTYSVDNSFLFLMIFMCIGILILAAMVAVHPIFIPLYFLGWIFVVFLGGVFSNVYQEMAADANFAATASSLTFLSGIMNTLPFLIGIIGMVLMIILYKVGSNQ